MARPFFLLLTKKAFEAAFPCLRRAEPGAPGAPRCPPAGPGLCRRLDQFPPGGRVVLGARAACWLDFFPPACDHPHRLPRRAEGSDGDGDVAGGSAGGSHRHGARRGEGKCCRRRSENRACACLGGATGPATPHGRRHGGARPRQRASGGLTDVGPTGGR